MESPDFAGLPPLLQYAVSAAVFLITAAAAAFGYLKRQGERPIITAKPADPHIEVVAASFADREGMRQLATAFETGMEGLSNEIGRLVAELGRANELFAARNVAEEIERRVNAEVEHRVSLEIERRVALQRQKRREASR